MLLFWTSITLTQAKIREKLGQSFSHALKKKSVQGRGGKACYGSMKSKNPRSSHVGKDP